MWIRRVLLLTPRTCVRPRPAWWPVNGVQISPTSGVVLAYRPCRRSLTAVTQRVRGLGDSEETHSGWRGPASDEHVATWIAMTGDSRSRAGCPLYAYQTRVTTYTVRCTSINRNTHGMTSPDYVTWQHSCRYWQS